MGMQGSLPDSLKKEVHYCLEQRREATHPELLGKEEREADYWGKREFPGSMHDRLFVITAVQVYPARGSTEALEVRVDLHSQATGTMKEM
jgi:hypothetical protein